MGTTRIIGFMYILGLYWGNIGITEKKTETTKVVQSELQGLYWGNMLGNAGRMSKKIETTGIIEFIQILGLYWDKSGVMENKMETTRIKG